MLILRCLRRTLQHTLRGAIWVIVLNRGNVVVHIQMRFLCNVYLYMIVSPYVFLNIFTSLGLSPPQMVHLLPVPNMKWAVYELSVIPALGTPEMARVR